MREQEQVLVKDSIAGLADCVVQATADWAMANGRTSAARSEETAALNRLNEAQKALDAALLELRRLAPRESDWKQRERRGEAVQE